MLDPVLRRLVDPTLDRVGGWLAARGASANAMTLGGLGVGLLSVPLLAYGAYAVALLAIAINRVIDGLDGPVARHSRTRQPLGGYLDIVCDMAFYAAVPVGFALADPGNAVWAALLLASFICTASSFLARALLAEQRGEADDGRRGRKSFFYSAGIIEGSETILAFLLFCLFPREFPWLAAIMTALCFWTAVARVLDAFRAGDEHRA
jgi:phosphatidylglycerophosphate synthase